jgi:hypothetical protein
MVGRQYRRCGFGAEALRALAGWIESFLILPVAALLPPEDHAAERLALATGFVRTDGAENGRQLWVRPRLD